MRRLISVTVIAVTTVLLLEVALQIHNPITIRLRGDRIMLPVNARYTVTNAPETGLDPVVVQRRNALGFRGPDVPPDFASRLSIVTIGGSTTENMPLADDKTWTAVMGAELARVRPDVWVNNAGLAGHSTIGHLVLLDSYVVPLHPRIVLFLTGFNDIGLAPTASPAPFAGWWNWWARYSEVVNLAWKFDRVRRGRHLRFDGTPYDVRTVPRRETPEEVISTLIGEHTSFIDGYHTRLAALVARSRRAGIEPILMTQPMLAGEAIDPSTGVNLATITDDDFALSGLAYWRLLERYNDATRLLARQTKTDLIDLAHLLPKDSRLFVDLVHFSNAGAAEVGHIAATRLAARFGGEGGV